VEAAVAERWCMTKVIAIVSPLRSSGAGASGPAALQHQRAQCRADPV